MNFEWKEILFLLIGAAIIGLGVYVKLKNRRMTRRGSVVNAMVVGSVQSCKNILGEQILCYENTIQISTMQGTVTKVLQEVMPREIGSYIRGYYDDRSGQFMNERDVNVNKGNGPVLLIGFGVVWCIIVLLAVWMKSAESGAVVVTRIFGYGIAVIFILVGAWVGIFTPGKRKKELGNTHSVEGRLVNFKVREGDDEADSYYPIYEYYQNGEPRVLCGNVGGSAKKYREIGRRVTIVINDVTGEVYCAEDNKSSGQMGWLFLAIGIVFFILLLFMDVQQHMSGEVKPLFELSQMGLSQMWRSVG